MAYPGMAFVFVVGVGLATILYYMFNDSNSHNSHGPHGNGNANNEGPLPDFRNSWSNDIPPRNRSKNRRKSYNGNDDIQCTICLTELRESVVVNISPCGHAFHKNCIISWQNQEREESKHPSCPLCRQKIESMR